MRRALHLALAMTAGCSPATAPIDAHAPPAADTAQSPLERSLPAPQNAAPAPGWSFAGFDVLHEAHLDRLALEAEAVAPDALLPHADAIPYGGASWGLAEARFVTPGGGALSVWPKGAWPHRTPRPAAYDETAPLPAALRDAAAGGNPLAIAPRAGGLDAIGAVRANARCAACHGDGLPPAAGAIWYRFEEIADD